MPTEGPSLWLAIVVGLLLVIAVNGWMYLDRDRAQKKVQQDIANADLEQKRLAGVKAAYLEKQRQADLYKRRVDVIDQLRASQSGPVDLLNAVGDTINTTDAVWLSKMTDNGKTIDVRGTALSHNAVANLIGNLKKSGFKAVEMTESKQDPKVKDFQAFNFTLTCEYVKSKS